MKLAYSASQINNNLNSMPPMSRMMFFWKPSIQSLKKDYCIRWFIKVKMKKLIKQLKPYISWCLKMSKTVCLGDSVVRRVWECQELLLLSCFISRICYLISRTLSMIPAKSVSLPCWKYSLSHRKLGNGLLVKEHLGLISGSRDSSNRNQSRNMKNKLIKRKRRKSKRQNL